MKLIKKMILKDEISRLNEKERNIIILRYFYNKSQKEVAANYGISQVQISRIEKKILLNSIIDEPLFQEGICARDYNKKRAIVMFLVKHKMVLALNLIMKFDTN